MALSFGSENTASIILRAGRKTRVITNDFGQW